MPVVTSEAAVAEEAIPWEAPASLSAAELAAAAVGEPSWASALLVLDGEESVADVGSSVTWGWGVIDVADGGVGGAAVVEGVSAGGGVVIVAAVATGAMDEVGGSVVAKLEVDWTLTQSRS